LYNAETWTLGKADYLENFKMWSWRTILKISWTARVRNEVVLQSVKKEKNNLQTIKRRKAY
jgi:hypothetical protein